MLCLCKSVEKRLWFTEHPLLQVPIHRELLARIVVGVGRRHKRQKRNLSLDDLRDMDNDEINAYLDQKNIGGSVHKYVRMVGARAETEG